MLLVLTALLFVAIGSAQARDFLVTDEDQKNILAICDIAARTPEQINRETRMGIAGYCLGWQRRIEAVNAPLTLPPDMPQEKK